MPIIEVLYVIIYILFFFQCFVVLFVFQQQDTMATGSSTLLPKAERHHCLLCHRSYSSGESYHMHVKSRFHRHLELTQRKTIHAMYRHFTGQMCPRLRPLSAKERKRMKWKPRSANVNHFYHEKTPLQIALHVSTLLFDFSYKYYVRTIDFFFFFSTSFFNRRHRLITYKMMRVFFF